jgi:hypothetical protein
MVDGGPAIHSATALACLIDPIPADVEPTPLDWMKTHGEDPGDSTGLTVDVPPG